MKYRLRVWSGRVLAVGLTAVFALRRLAQGRRAPRRPPRSVLIVRFDLMGDVVNALSAAAAARARWPAARIVVAAPPQWQPIVRSCPAVDEGIGFDGGRVTHWPGVVDPRAWRQALRVLRKIRARRFDLAVSVYGPIAGVAAALSGARWCVGYRAEAPRWSFDRALPGRRRNGGPHEAELAARLVGGPVVWHTCAAPPPARPRPAPAQSRPLVVLHPGASHGSAKRWPDRHWAALAALLAPRVGALGMVGLADARPLARRVAAAAPNAADHTGATSLDDLIRLLASADVVVSTDSGPGHLARALGRSVVMLHGPTDVAVHGPGGPRARALRVDLPCGPCYAFDRPAECIYGDALCMRWLQPQVVLRAVLDLLP